MISRTIITAASSVLDGPVELDAPVGDSLTRAMVEIEVEAALGIDVPEADRGRWTTLRELVGVVERVMGADR